MPGLEVNEDGTVKVNGKSVSKITINGKTFFMGDNKAALDNLPANFVNKVKVTDKESDEAQFTGIKTGEKQTEMDIELKEEYKKGFFGNLKLAGGTTIKGKNDNEFIVNKPFLLDASTMMSAYGEKNQLTAIANARNVVSEGYGIMMWRVGGALDDLSLGTDGINSNWSAGANLNSDAIKGFSSNVSVKFDQNKSESRSKSDRTTFMEGSESLHDVQNSDGIGTLDNLSVKMELRKKDRKKFMLHFYPSFTYKNMNDASSSNSVSTVGEEEKNKSESHSSTSMKQYQTQGRLNLGINNLGKEKRSIGIGGSYNFQKIAGIATDMSNTVFADGSVQARNLLHDKDNRYSSFYAELNYVEPFTKTWSLQTTLTANYSEKQNLSAAFNPDGSTNDYYSSINNNYYTSFEAQILAQYSKEANTIHFGVEARAIENQNYARSYGLDTRTGEGEWQTNISPFVNYMYQGKKMRHSVYLMSYTQQPTTSNIIPSFNIVNPTRLSIGNIYLKPSFSNNLNFNTGGKLGSVMLDIYASERKRSKATVYANWFDANSVRYSIPVNSLKPQYSGVVVGNVSIPLNKEKTVTITYYTSLNFSHSTSYQAAGVLGGIDTESFEYAKFMEAFWGNAQGDRFYGGASGFSESITNSYSYDNNLNLRLNFERFTMNASASLTNSRSNYSLNPKANTNTWSNRFSINPQYEAPYEIKISLGAFYTMRRGFGAGYDDDYFDMNFKITKDFKAFSIGLNGVNLLNNVKSVYHDVSQDYVQDSYSLIMGRRVLLLFTWNFGKMSKGNADRARRASMNMSW